MCFEKCIEFHWCVVQRQDTKSARSILNFYNVESTSCVHALALVCFAAGMPRGSWEISAPCSNREDTSETHPASLPSGPGHKETGWRRPSVEILPAWWEKRMWAGWCLRTLLTWLVPSVGCLNPSEDRGGHQCELWGWVQGRQTFPGSSTCQNLWYGKV